MDMTHLVKSRATCPRRAVGAVIVKQKHVLTTGYNGAPKNFPHPLDVGCIRDELGIPSGMMADVCPCLHAEQNALLQAALFGVSVEGADIYCTTQPCTQCSRMIANSGIKRVVFEEEYADPLAIGLLTTAGVALWRWDHEAGEARPYDKINTWEQAQDELRERWARQRAVLEGRSEAAAPATPATATAGPGAAKLPSQSPAQPPQPAQDSRGSASAEPAEVAARAEPGVRDLTSDPRRQEILKRMARERAERLAKAADEQS